MVTLDMNLDEELDYREIARGMEAWKRERRDERRKELSREITSVSMKSGDMNELLCEKTCLQGVQPGLTQIGL